MSLLSGKAQYDDGYSWFLRVTFRLKVTLRNIPLDAGLCRLQFGLLFGGIT